MSLTDDVLAILFRNTRELLANVVKHAQADKVSVRLASSEGTIRITVEDDGQGFATDAVAIGKEARTVSSASANVWPIWAARWRSSPRQGEGCKATLVAPVWGGGAGETRLLTEKEGRSRHREVQM